MERPEAFLSDEAYASAWRRRCDAHYKAMVSYRYHRKRQRFFDLLDKCTKALTVIAGASLLAEPIKQSVPFVALGISAIGLLSLVFGYGDRKQSHKELAEAFASAVAKIEGTAHAQLTSQLVATWDSETSAISAKEPPQLHALVTICEREQSIANGHPNHVPQLSFIKRIAANWLSFG
jgi:hypothetical protein